MTAGAKNIPKGYCFRFNSGQRCNGCNFNHTCSRCRTGKHPAKRCRSVKRASPVNLIPVVSRLPTPVSPKFLDNLLQGYDKDKREYLVQGFSFGFHLNSKGMSVSSQSTNLKSALENAKIVQEKLNKELLKDRIAGPSDSPPFSNFVCSPIGAVPKKQSGKFRLIHHL